MTSELAVISSSNSKDRRVEDERLKRIEDKMDVMADGLKELIAVQRDVQHLFHRLDRLEKQIDEASKQIRRVSNDEASSSSGSAMFEKIILAVLASGVGVLATLIMSNVE
ncbi:MAG: hypothetical protein LC687_01280 [Actinobacteria bacterium]|nr:hypothetical protein [Actinomycetota bacterium]MCA1806488.1 hypothetical protein [Actinomycetota bacterium]